MFQTIKYDGSLQEQYASVQKQLQSLIEGEPNVVANLSNFSALLNQFLHDVNWVGFYLTDTESEKKELVLGPFQGLPACIRIPFPRGVCGHAASTKETVVVPNVHEFPGHIACDGATQSEVVIPIMKDDAVFGVLDIDSPVPNRFSNEEAQLLEELVRMFEKTL